MSHLCVDYFYSYEEENEQKYCQLVKAIGLLFKLNINLASNFLMLKPGQYILGYELMMSTMYITPTFGIVTSWKLIASYLLET